MKCDSCGAEPPELVEQRFVLGKFKESWIGYSEGQRVFFRTIGETKEIGVSLCYTCLARENQLAKRVAMIFGAFAAIFIFGTLGVLAAGGQGMEKGTVFFMLLLGGICAAVAVWQWSTVGKHDELARDFVRQKGLTNGFDACWTLAEFEKVKEEHRQHEQKERERLDALAGVRRPKE